MGRGCSPLSQEACSSLGCSHPPLSLSLTSPPPPAHEAPGPGKEGPPPACTPSGSSDPCSVCTAQKCSRGRSRPGCGESCLTGLHGPGVVQHREWGLQAGSPGPEKLSEGVITGACLCPWLGVHSRGICARAHTCVRWGGLARTFCLKNPFLTRNMRKAGGRCHCGPAAVTVGTHCVM